MLPTFPEKQCIRVMQRITEKGECILIETFVLVQFSSISQLFSQNFIHLHIHAQAFQSPCRQQGCNILMVLWTGFWSEGVGAPPHDNMSPDGLFSKIVCWFLPDIRGRWTMNQDHSWCTQPICAVLHMVHDTLPVLPFSFHTWSSRFTFIHVFRFQGFLQFFEHVVYLLRKFLSMISVHECIHLTYEMGPASLYCFEIGIRFPSVHYYWRIELFPQVCLLQQHPFPLNPPLLWEHPFQRI